MKSAQFELPKSEAVFNLSGQAAEDPWRVEREKIEQRQREAETRDYQERMQLRLGGCPGFAGCDAPTGPLGKGKVVVQPGLAAEARVWLKRRFHVSENLELSHIGGLVFEIAPRIRRVTTGGHRVKVSFAKPVQFELAL